MKNRLDGDKNISTTKHTTLETYIGCISLMPISIESSSSLTNANCNHNIKIILPSATNSLKLCKILTHIPL